MENLKIDKKSAKLILKVNGLSDYKLPRQGQTLCCNVPYGQSFFIKKIDKNIFEFRYA